MLERGGVRRRTRGGGLGTVRKIYIAEAEPVVGLILLGSGDFDWRSSKRQAEAREAGVDAIRGE